MINYAPKARSFYVDPNNPQAGLGAQQLTDHEWNLLALTSRSFFCWEGSKVPMEIRHARFDDDTLTAVRGTLQQRLQASLIKELIEILDPAELVLLFASSDISHLDLVKRWGTVNNLMLVMEARMLVWMSSQRKANGNVFQLRVLSPEQYSFVNSVNPWENGQIKWR